MANIDSCLKLISKLISDPLLLLPLIILGWTTILLPEKLASQLRVQLFYENYAEWIFIATIIFSSILIMIKFNSWKYKKSILNRLYSLSPEERMVLLECFLGDTQTAYLPIIHGGANALVKKNILVMSSMGNKLRYPYTIQDNVWKYIQKNEMKIFPELKNEVL